MINRKLLLFVFMIGSMSFVVSNSFYIPDGWPKPIYSFQRNGLTQNKIFLGRMLFYDPILSINNSISCGSCHSQFNAFTHADHALSHGIYDSIGNRNSPTLMNLAWQPYFMWDGSINHLDMQALAPISHPKEMGENLEHVLQKLNTSKRYRALFYEAWSDSNATSESLLKSLSQFMLTMVSYQSRYDSMQLGEINYTSQEKRGYVLFKKHCNSCHTEPLFTSYQFKSNGLKPNPQLHDLGRFAISGLASDSFKFKIPSLRNIEYSFPYMHDGRFESLTEVIQFYSKESNVGGTNGSRAIQLSSEDKVDLQVFLLTLTDKNFLFNAQLGFPKELLLNE